jgi:hypothetical protein
MLYTAIVVEGEVRAVAERFTGNRIIAPPWVADPEAGRSA